MEFTEGHRNHTNSVLPQKHDDLWVLSTRAHPPSTPIRTGFDLFKAGFDTAQDRLRQAQGEGQILLRISFCRSW
jgi:hypothetical protein